VEEEGQARLIRKSLVEEKMERLLFQFIKRRSLASFWETLESGSNGGKRMIEKSGARVVLIVRATHIITEVQRRGGGGAQ